MRAKVHAVGTLDIVRTRSASIAFSATLCALVAVTSPANATSWVQLSGYWIDNDSIRWNGNSVEFTYYDGPGQPGAGPIANTYLPHIKYDCSTGREYIWEIIDMEDDSPNAPRSWEDETVIATASNPMFLHFCRR